MRKYLTIPVVALLGLLGGCGAHGDDGSSSRSTEKVAIVVPTTQQPALQVMKIGFEQGAKTYGWDVSILDSQLSPDKQVANIDTAVSQGDDGIASWTLDPGAAAAAYDRAVAAGIPVVGLSSEGEGVAGSVWLETSTCNPGGPADQNAQYIAKKTPGAKVVVIGGPPNPSLDALQNCFSAAATKAGLIVMGTTRNTGDSPDAALRLAQDLFTKYPGVQAIWAYNDQSALGASAALTSNGKNVATDNTDGVIVIGNNADTEAIAAIREGRLTATWEPNNLAFGLAVIKQLHTAMKGGAKGTYPSLTVKADMVTSGNVDAYTDPMQREYTLDTLPLVE